MRSYNRSWKSLKNEKFLKYIYESGIGFFHCNNGHTFDMVVPIRIKSDDGFSYVPMLISIKSFTEYQAKPVTDFWEAATQKLNSAGISRALCLCIVFGMNDPTKPAVENEYELQKTEKIMKKLKEKLS